MGKKRYMELLLEQIRNKKAKEMVSDEVEHHIDDQIEAYLQDGMTENEAEKKAVFDMGDPVETGASLDRIHKPRMSWSMVLLIGIISALGLLVHLGIQRSAGGDVSGIFVQNQIVYVAVGFAVMLVVCVIDYSVIGRWGNVLAVCFLAVCVYYAVFGISVNGAQIYLAGIGVSLNALIYLSVPLFGILLYDRRSGGWQQLMVPIAFMVFVICLFRHCFGSVVLFMNLVLMAAVILSAAVAKGWFHLPKKKFLIILWSAVIGLPVLFVMICFASQSMPHYVIARFQEFYAGNWPVYAYGGMSVENLLAQCRLLGAAAAGQPEIADLVGIHSDYTVLYVVSRFGILALLVVILLFAVLCYKMFRMSFCQKNQLGMIMGLSCSLVFLVQIAEYILMNLGLLPPTTVFLPLFSYGGSGTIVSYFLLGILLSVYRYQNLATDRKAKPRLRLTLEMREL